jgi:antitoxin component of MazEF toxin-antitoxin module
VEGFAEGMVLLRRFVDVERPQIRIPSAIAKQMDINEGAEVAFHIDGKRLVIEKAERIPKFTHHDLVKALRKTKKSLVDFGVPRGREML